ncbi:MAG TPA: hypothetical protein VGR07_01995 [Thermoanaerobaculia bacterium]|nr:hypothetical protein [Thermoanaerobaculia bacterium]
MRYFVNPARAVVVHAGQTSRLSVTLDGAPVKRDVSAAQVAFWNDGRAAIKPDNMLRQLVIKTSPTAPIIDATIRKRSREVVKVELDRSRLAQGELTAHWNILEFRDGAVLQIVYLGKVDTAVTASATVEGQGDLPKVRGKQTHHWSWGIIVGLITGMAGSLLFALLKRNKYEWLFDAIMSAALALVFLFLVNNYPFPAELGPPFGF